MNNFDEFVNLWKSETKDIKLKKELKHMLFLVVYPDKLKWDFGIEKQTQTTTFMMSGGDTGASTGHDIRFCYRSQVHNILLKCDHTHAMIVSVGMIFNMIKSKPSTPITNFYDFVKSGQFCKAHIIAKPNSKAFFHHQHMNLNLTMWKKVGAPDMSERYDVVKRSPDNFHDDYTPPWIEVEEMPTVINFTKGERLIKSFSYYRDHQTEAWKDLDNVDIKDYYFSIIMKRIRKQFYIENTEKVGKLPIEKFDIIFSTTAGYRAALLANQLEFDGEIVLYDYCQENLDIKQMIIEMNMSLKEIESYWKSRKLRIVNGSWRRRWPNYMSARIDQYTFEDLRKLEEKMQRDYDIEYWLMDLISPNYDKILEKIKGKSVFFDATNIFSYHVSHAYYTLDELVSSYKKLLDVLTSSNGTFYRGTLPTKQWELKWI